MTTISDIKEKKRKADNPKLKKLVKESSVFELKCDKCGAVISAKVEANLEARKLPPITGESTKQKDYRTNWNESIDDIKRIAKGAIDTASKTSQSGVANGGAAREVASCPKCGKPGKAKPA